MKAEDKSKMATEQYPEDGNLGKKCKENAGNKEGKKENLATKRRIEGRAPEIVETRGMRSPESWNARSWKARRSKGAAKEEN